MSSSCSQPVARLLLFGKRCHVQITVVPEAAFVHLDAHRADLAQTGSGSVGDADDVVASLDLPVESFKRVGALQVLVMLEGQAVEGQHLADVRLGSVDELRMLRPALAGPGGQIAMSYSRS